MHIGETHQVDRAYISNIAPGWTIEQQIELLAQSVVGWPVLTYRDELKRRQLKARDPAKLEQRAALLRPTSRKTDGDTLHVASLAVMAWRAKDFAEVLAVLADRKFTIVDHHEGLTFDLTYADERLRAFEQFPLSRQRGSRHKGRLVGAKISADRRNAKSKAACEPIRELWGLPTGRTADLVAATGFSRHTVERWLGKRPAAQARYVRNLKRQQAKAIAAMTQEAATP